MRIAIITNHLSKGGITSYVSLAKRAIEERGHLVWVIAGRNKDNVMEPDLDIDVFSKNEFDIRTINQFRRVARFIRDNGVDIVWAHTRIAQMVATLASRGYCPFITTAHGFIRPSLSRKIFPLWGDKVVAISGAVRDHLLNAFHLPDEKVVMIYNAVDIRAMDVICEKSMVFASSAKERIGFRRDSFIFGQMARICDIKGQAIAVKAFDMVAKDWPHAGLLFVGSGRERDERRLMDAIETSMFRERILWYKHIEDPALFWAAIDVFLVPSSVEGFGLAAAEAQYMEKPVIASSVGGLKEVVVDKSTGLLFHIYSAEALAEKLVFAMNNDKMIKEMAKCGKERVRSLFSEDRFAEGCIKVLQSVVAKRSDK